MLRVCSEYCLRNASVMAWIIRDDRLLISIRNSFFSGSPFGQNCKVKRAQLDFSGTAQNVQMVHVLHNISSCTIHRMVL